MKLHSVAVILCKSARGDGAHVSWQRALELPLMYNKLGLEYDWICCCCVILLLITPLFQTCNEMTHWSGIWLYLKAVGMTMMLPCQHFQPNILYLWNKHTEQSSQASHANEGIKKEDEAEEHNISPFRGSILQFSIFQSCIFIDNVMFSLSLSRECLEWWEIISVIICFWAHS